MVDELARIKGLYSVLNHVPERLQKLANRMGDCVSRKVALKVLDDVSSDYDAAAKNIKRSVEMLYEGGLTPRTRTAMAMRLDIKGGSIFADNVGKVLLIIGGVQKLISITLSDGCFTIQHW